MERALHRILAVGWQVCGRKQLQGMGVRCGWADAPVVASCSRRMATHAGIDESWMTRDMVEESERTHTYVP